MNYLLISENREYLNRQEEIIISKLKQEDEIDYFSYDYIQDKISIADLIAGANTIPFLSDRKVIKVMNPLFLTTQESLNNDDQNLLIKYFENPNPTTTLIFTLEGSVDNRKKIVKTLKKTLEVYEQKELNEYEMKEMIKKDLATHQLQVTNQGLRLLNQRVLKNFDGWPNELEKLILQNKKELDLTDIDLLISDYQVDHVFEISDAIINQQLDQALLMWRNQPLAQREPISMMMLLASQFRLMHHIKVLLDQGLYEQEIAQRLKVHPYRVKVSLPRARRYSYHDLLHILSQLSSLDQEIKNGIIDPSIGFELFLVRVSIQ